VTDLEGLLNRDEEESVEQLLWQVEAQTGVEIAIVVIGSMADYPGSVNDSIESFATGLFDKYGVGNLPRNNGVLLLVARSDRKARIELGKGYGRSRDADAAKIMDGHIIPQFKQDRYARGIRVGVQEIVEEFAGVATRGTGVNWVLIVLIVAIPVVGVIAYSLFKSGKRGWGWVCIGILVILVLAVIKILVTMAQRSEDSGSSGSWSSGGFGGGFGGGSSGGGGASGSW